MAITILNDWRDSLLLKVAMYAKLINEDWDEFTINITTYTVKQVNSFILHHILFYRNSHYADL